LRLLYGRAVAGGKQGQTARRKAIFVALSRYDQEVLRMFVDIALESIDGSSILDRWQRVQQPIQEFELNVPPRQQLGMLNMIGDMLDVLGPDLEAFTPHILDAVLLCTVAASRHLENKTNDDGLKTTSLLRSIRQV